MPPVVPSGISAAIDGGARNESIAAIARPMSLYRMIIVLRSSIRGQNTQTRLPSRNSYCSAPEAIVEISGNPKSQDRGAVDIG
jgi:hypothetical protein